MSKARGPAQKWQVLKAIQDGKNAKQKLASVEAQFTKLLETLPTETKEELQTDLGVDDLNVSSFRELVSG